MGLPGEEFSLSKNRISELIGSVVASRNTSRDAIIYRLYLLGWTNEEIGKMVGLTEGSIRGNRKNSNFTKITNEYKQGKPIEQIAEYYGLDLTTTYAIRLQGLS